MDILPSDPVILLGYLNMKLRDEYESPEALIRGLDIDEEIFNEWIEARCISYFAEGKRFVID